MSFTGRRKTGLGDSILRGLSALGTAMADGPKYARISEIDTAVAELLQERDHLIYGLIEPGELKVSDNYDPRWRKPAVEENDETPIMDQYFGAGTARLTECKGRDTMSTYHDAHPGCPYVAKVHTSHEFTLRD